MGVEKTSVVLWKVYIGGVGRWIDIGQVGMFLCPVCLCGRACSPISVLLSLCLVSASRPVQAVRMGKYSTE